MNKMTRPACSVLGFLAAVLATGFGPALAQQVPAGVLEALCAKRQPCSVAGVKPAGTDKQGNTLSVVELNLGEKNAGNENFPCRPYRQEFWVIGGAQPQNILKLCNDGYGASGVGEDTVTVSKDTVLHNQMGGSSWRWSVTKEYGLSPVRVKKVSECGYHTNSPSSGASYWDFHAFRGESGMLCGAGEEAELGVCGLKNMAHTWIEIPQIIDVRFEGKKLSPALGSCGLRLDGSGTSGYILLGKRTADTPEVRILMLSDTELLVTVVDDKFVTGTKSWVHDDHLEVWLGAPWSYISCNDGEPSAKPVQWGIRTADGKAFKGFGKPPMLPLVTGHRIGEIGGQKAASFRIVLPKKIGDVNADYRNIAVSYSKSDGKKQVLLFATSPIKFGDPRTLGDTRKLGKQVQCEIRNGVLDVVDAGLPAERE